MKIIFTIIKRVSKIFLYTNPNHKRVARIGVIHAKKPVKPPKTEIKHRCFRICPICPDPSSKLYKIFILYSFM